MGIAGLAAVESRINQRFLRRRLRFGFGVSKFFQKTIDLEHRRAYFCRKIVALCGSNVYRKSTGGSARGKSAAKQTRSRRASATDVRPRAPVVQQRVLGLVPFTRGPRSQLRAPRCGSAFDRCPATVLIPPARTVSTAHATTTSGTALVAPRGICPSRLPTRECAGLVPPIRGRSHS